MQNGAKRGNGSYYRPPPLSRCWVRPPTRHQPVRRRPTVEPHLFLQQDAAQRELSRIAREAMAAAIAEHGDPLGRMLDALGGQTGVLTLDRAADMLGVAPRTVTDTYVAKLGLPAHRTGRTSPPLFVLGEVEAWVRSLSSDGSSQPAAASSSQREGASSGVFGQASDTSTAPAPARRPSASRARPHRA